jgi:hypothetical protein
MVRPEEVDWNFLFKTLEQWERDLARLDSESLRCDHEHLTP